VVSVVLVALNFVVGSSVTVRSSVVSNSVVVSKSVVDSSSVVDGRSVGSRGGKGSSETPNHLIAAKSTSTVVQISTCKIQFFQ
jgi:hypothetical protein